MANAVLGKEVQDCGLGTVLPGGSAPPDTSSCLLPHRTARSSEGIYKSSFVSLQRVHPRTASILIVLLDARNKC